MNKEFADKAWEDWMFWMTNDKKVLKKIDRMLKEIERLGPDQGIGDPEPLKYELAGYWSRELDKKNRLIYTISDNCIHIASCRGHYGDK